MEGSSAPDRLTSSPGLLDSPNAATFITVPPVVAAPTITLFSMLLHNCKFATAVNGSVDI